ncbi:MAG TPA: phosphotransferase family protein [Micromonosporaceae bacterium]|jgi:aminoglycoside phosphotransferase (APT) family kinase protein|nr:phosphotransferase family protein [Micromonosporaceae bacterium]
MNPVEPADQAPAGVDLVALRRFIDTADPPGTAGSLTGELISGGKSNLTYRISDGVRTWILRRPPLGLVLATAHDMNRECRILRALADSAVPVPTVVAQQPTADVLDAPFYLMREVDGLVYRSRDQAAGLSPRDAARLGEALVDTLAALHDMDYRQTGLEGFGRPEGYLERQVTRWLRQWDAAHLHDYPQVEALGRRLIRALPAGGGAGIVHGDYRIDNVIVDRTDPGTIAAVLDWEMSTLGDPLADLGILLCYWDEPGRPYNPVTGGLTAVPGFPSHAEVISRYAARRSRDVPDIDWYVVFADFKLAIILEQIHTRHVQGHTVGGGFDQVGEAVWPLLERALETAARASGSGLRVS